MQGRVSNARDASFVWDLFHLDERDFPHARALVRSIWSSFSAVDPRRPTCHNLVMRMLIIDRNHRVTRLKIGGRECQETTFLDDVYKLEQLECLTFISAPNVISLPSNGLQNLYNLTSLLIYDLASLEQLPNELGSLVNLTFLKILGCISLRTSSVSSTFWKLT